MSLRYLIACAIAFGSSPVVAVHADHAQPEACPAPAEPSSDAIVSDMVCTTNCTPCLVGQEWDALRKENGLAGILRDTVVTLDMNNWLSAYVQTSLMRILIGEMLGYEVKFAWNIDANEIERLASGEVTMNPEIWSSDTNKRGDFERYVPHCVVPEYMGVLGIEQLYTPEDGTCAVSGVNTLRNHRDIFAPDGTTEITAAFNASCQHEQWPLTNCVDGKFLPPACRAPPFVDGEPSPWCAEMLLATPRWSPAWYEAAMINLDLNFSAVYLGSDLSAEIERRAAAGDNFVFYWWEPDPLFERLKATPIALPPWSEECTASYTKEPTTSGVDCVQRTDRLVRGVHAATYDSHADLAWFHDHFHLSNSEIQTIMVETTSGGGELSVDDAVCAWLKNNTDVWTDSTRHVEEKSNRRRRNHKRDAFAAWGWIVVVAGAAAMGLYVVYRVTMATRHKINEMRRSDEKMSADRLARLQRCVDAVHCCEHPMVVVRLDVFEKFGKLPKFEDVRGSVLFLDTYADAVSFSSTRPVVFVSHQWLARDEPDPDGVHFAAICRAVRLVAAEWREAPKDMYLWVDFCCVPQANRNTQEMAIQSLPVFASACRYFVAVCPESTHESGAVVDVATYGRRGWCRLEMWCFLSQKGGLSRMHVYDGEGFRPVAGREDWYREAMCVFEGEFSVEADKARLVDVVLGLHARGIRGDAGPPSLPPSPLNRLSEYETTASSLNEFTLASPTATPHSTTASPRASDALVSPGSRASSRRSLQRVDSAVGSEIEKNWWRRGAIFPRKYFGTLADELEARIAAGDIRWPEAGASFYSRPHFRVSSSGDGAGPSVVVTFSPEEGNRALPSRDAVMRADA